MQSDNPKFRQLAERRGFTRISFKTDVEVRWGGNTIRSNKGIDVSLSGLCLPAGDPVPEEGAVCEARIILGPSDSDPVVIEAKGAVVRSEPGALAVRFTEMDLDSYWHLRQLILANACEPEQAEREFTTHQGIRSSRK